MQIDQKITARFTHDALKPIKMAVFYFQTLLADSKIGPTDKTSLEPLVEALSATTQVVEDFQLLSGSETIDRERWEEFVWNDIVGEHVALLKKRNGAPFEAEIPQTAVRATGHLSLIKYALQNMKWFVRHFGNKLVSIRLAESTRTGSKVAELTYNISTSVALGPDFERCEPFLSMSREGKSIDQNSGLILCAVKRIMELHGGHLLIQAQETNATLNLILPLAEHKEASNYE